MNKILEKYLPELAVEPCFDIIKSTNAHLKVVRKRATKYGDFRVTPDGDYLITINATPNRYRFLITLVHELAHLVTYSKYGTKIKPHGKEWKKNFKELISPMLISKIFPEKILPTVKDYFKDPKASSDTDSRLLYELQYYDEANDLVQLSKLNPGCIFKLHNGRIFEKGEIIRKRYKCKEVSTKRIYLFNPSVGVELLNES